MIVATDPSFAERLKSLREHAGLSQYELARRSTVSKQAISLLEKGTNEPSWDTVRKLARGLGLTVLAFDVTTSTDDIPGELAPGHQSEPPTLRTAANEGEPAAQESPRVISKRK